MEIKMTVSEADISLLKIASYNPRSITPEVMEKLKKSIQENQVYSPPIVNKVTGNVIGGNQRVAALQELGYKTVHVVWVDLSLEKEKLLNIQLNKISGEWDLDKLSVLLDELSKMPDIEVTDTGFDLPEISQIFDKHGVTREEDGFDFDAAVNSIEKPVTQPGDFIVIGNHRLMCADAGVLENLEHLFGVEVASLYWSDWPYGVNYDAGNRPGAKESKWTTIKNDDLKGEKHIQWMRQVVSVTITKLKPGASVYIWNGHAQFWSMSQILIEVGIHPACIISWIKPSFSPGWCDYQHASEFCLYGWLNNGSHSFYGEAESTVWQSNRDSSNALIHPTQKPVELAQRAIRNSSQRGEIVFDSCLGSGSALIAAESLGRRCFGFEIEPSYCDAIVRRWVAYVGRENAPADIVEKYFTKEVANEQK